MIEKWFQKVFAVPMMIITAQVIHHAWSLQLTYSGMGFFRFLTEIVFSEPFGSFLRSMQIRFNNFRGGGGGFMQLFSKLMVCQSFLCVIFYWLLSTLNIAICDASLLLSSSFTADVSFAETSNMPYNSCV